jgi:ATP-binding cassette subfamily B (MDR/TAP) protein 7
MDDFALLTHVWSLRTQFRRQANKADNKAADVSVDALINYEAVKVGDMPAFIQSTL